MADLGHSEYAFVLTSICEFLHLLGFKQIYDFIDIHIVYNLNSLSYLGPDGDISKTAAKRISYYSGNKDLLRPVVPDTILSVSHTAVNRIRFLLTWGWWEKMGAKPKNA